MILLQLGNGNRERQGALTESRTTIAGDPIIRVVAGKGGKDCDLPLSPTLLETLREYWRWRTPKLYMFPTRTLGHRLHQPISDKTVWIVMQRGRTSGWHQQTRHAAHLAP